jgi:hypothetical protein
LAQLRLNDTSAGEQDLAAARKLKPSIDKDARMEGFEFVGGAMLPALPGS